MQRITKEEFDNIKIDDAVQLPAIIDSAQFKSALESLRKNPVDVQSDLAAKLKIFLDGKIENELKEHGVLSKDTREWVALFNDMLNSLNKSINGDKVDVKIQVTHAHISQMMRKYRVVNGELK